MSIQGLRTHSYVKFSGRIVNPNVTLPQKPTGNSVTHSALHSDGMDELSVDVRKGWFNEVSPAGTGVLYKFLRNSMSGKTALISVIEKSGTSITLRLADPNNTFLNMRIFFNGGVATGIGEGDGKLTNPAVTSAYAKTLFKV